MEDVKVVNSNAQDEKWKDADIDGRAHVSHRELASAHSSQFQKAIEEFNTVEEIVYMHICGVAPWSNLTLTMIEQIVSYSMNGNDALVFESARRRRLYGLFTLPKDHLNSNFRICVRKRPLLDFELADGQYDVVHMTKMPILHDSDADHATAQTVCVHDGKLSRNGRRLSMVHKSFLAHDVWREDMGNAEVCARGVAPLLESARAGKSGTLIMFGQTGTGKTYTLNAALDYLATAMDRTAVEIVLYEIHGKKSYDLLNNRKPVSLLTDGDGRVHAKGATVATCSTAEETRTCISKAIELRSSAVTERNPISSRSHAICQMRIPCVNAATGAPDVATLSLIDLAGSERNYETTNMTAAMHKESADINISLMALKDCFRTYHDRVTFTEHDRSRTPSPTPAADEGEGDVASAEPTAVPSSDSGEEARMDSLDDELAQLRGKENTAAPLTHKLVLATKIKGPRVKKPARVNFRAHLLTRVLQACFLEEGHKTCIVVTISPTPTDLYHSLNSLDHALKMCPQLYAAIKEVTCDIPLADMPSSSVPVTEWTSVQVQAWLASADNGRFASLALPQNLDGSALMGMNRGELSALFAGELRRARIEEEGAAWVVQTATGQTAIGDAFWASLHREQQRALSICAAQDDIEVNKGFMRGRVDPAERTGLVPAPPNRKTPISLGAAIRQEVLGMAIRQEQMTPRVGHMM